MLFAPRHGYLEALAIGANAICNLWGFGAFGQSGVERVLDVLIRELEIAMTQMGTASLPEITPRSIVVSGRVAGGIVLRNRGPFHLRTENE